MKNFVTISCIYCEHKIPYNPFNPKSRQWVVQEMRKHVANCFKNPLIESLKCGHPARYIVVDFRGDGKPKDLCLVCAYRELLEKTPGVLLEVMWPGRWDNDGNNHTKSGGQDD